MRKLSRIEQALTLTHKVYPLTAVCVLRLANSPVPEAVRHALQQLQQAHALLNASIVPQGDGFCFEPIGTDTNVPMQSIDRHNGQQWLSLAQQEVNRGFSDSKGPLWKAIYLSNGQQGEDTELLLCFHHAIVDNDAILGLANALLQYLGSGVSIKPCADGPLMESILPAAVKGPSLVLRLAAFMARQVGGEIAYKRVARQNPDLPVPAGSENHLLSANFGHELTDTVIRTSRSQRVSINSLIGAAMLMAVQELRYQGRDKRMRIIMFAALRRSLSSPVSPEQLGCYISMMRFTLSLHKGQQLLALARLMDVEVSSALKRNDPFLFNRMSKMMIRQTIRKQDQRLGHAALSYAGPVKLQEQYGSISVRDIHGYITNNKLGAEFTAFGKLFRGELGLDINFLSAEMTREQAVQLQDRTIQLLQQLSP